MLVLDSAGVPRPDASRAWREHLRAAEEHRFVNIAEDFTVIVVFGPAESSRANDVAEPV